MSLTIISPETFVMDTRVWDASVPKHARIPNPALVLCVSARQTAADTGEPVISTSRKAHKCLKIPQKQGCGPKGPHPCFVNSLMRHLEDYRKGKLVDKEMLTHAMGHVAVNAMFLWWFTREKYKKERVMAQMGIVFEFPMTLSEAMNHHVYGEE